MGSPWSKLYLREYNFFITLRGQICIAMQNDATEFLFLVWIEKIWKNVRVYNKQGKVLLKKNTP